MKKALTVHLKAKLCRIVTEFVVWLKSDGFQCLVLVVFPATKEFMLDGPAPDKGLG